MTFFIFFLVLYALMQLLKPVLLPRVLDAADRRRSANAVASHMAREALEAAKREDDHVCEMMSTRVLEERYVRAGIMELWEMTTCEDGYDCKDCTVTLNVIEDRRRQAAKHEAMLKKAKQEARLQEARALVARKEEERRAALTPEERIAEDTVRINIQAIDQLKERIKILESDYERERSARRRAERRRYYY